MASIYTPHFIQFLDDDGNILSGGKLYTYDAGTTTPKATYTAADGITPNANPVVLDSSGRATVFLSGSYKFRLEDSLGNLIEETDNVTAFSTAESGVDDIVTNFTEAVIAADDNIIFADTSDGNATRRDTVQGILDLSFQSGDPTIFESAYTALSGTSITIGSIPAGVKRVTISFHDLSGNGTSLPIVQIGTGAVAKTSGYVGGCSGNQVEANFSNGFIIGAGTNAAVNVMHGTLTLNLVDSSTNHWVVFGVGGFSNIAAAWYCGGHNTLSGALDTIFLTFANGTDTFDAGNATVSWEF